MQAFEGIFAINSEMHLASGIASAMFEHLCASFADAPQAYE